MTLFRKTIIGTRHKIQIFVKNLKWRRAFWRSRKIARDSNSLNLVFAYKNASRAKKCALATCKKGNSPRFFRGVAAAWFKKSLVFCFLFCQALTQKLPLIC
jgi:hypothetical protein